jgi:NAD(P)-dependent dehydrogenase (short-subunit alcohol dehydrogenase family)
VTFAPGLLAGRRVAIAGNGDAAGAAGRQLEAVGAHVAAIPADVLADEDSAAGWARACAPLHGLLYDGAGAFREGGADPLRVTMEHAWRAVRAVVTGALIESPDPGRILLIAPRPHAGPHAPAARAALENLARTLSVEWARHAITVVALWPGEATTDDELAQLAGFLLSAAGGYFSGCRFELGGVVVRAR